MWAEYCIYICTWEFFRNESLSGNSGNMFFFFFVSDKLTKLEEEERDAEFCLFRL